MRKVMVSLVAIVSAVGISLILFYYRSFPSIIKPVDSFTVLYQELSSLNQRSLVIFDVDRVLLIEKDPWERGYRAERKKAQTIPSLFIQGSPLAQQLDRGTRDRLWSVYVQALKEILVEDRIVEILKALQKKAVKVIALTRFLVGKVGVIEALEDLRIERLKSLGIDLSSSFPDIHYLEFKQFAYEDKSPVFKNGILFTTFACAKGELLAAFFEAIGWWPHEVLMFDDKLENLQSVQEVLKKMRIPFKGFQYTRASALSAFFHKDIAEFQMRYLIDHGTWIDAAKAHELISKRLSFLEQVPNIG